jgi:predicted secreted protein
MNGSYKRQAIAAAVLVLLIIGTAVAAAGCGGAAKADGVVKITEADNGKNITVKSGDLVQVILEGNPTTGYEWTVTIPDASKGVLPQQGQAVYAQQNTGTNVVGAGGAYTFTFKGATAGQTTLTFGYARPFEKGKPPIKTFTVNITVK